MNMLQGGVVFLFDMLLAIVLAAIVIALLSPADRYGTGGGVVALAFFFFLFFPLIWAAGVWMGPVGPAIGGVFWLSFLIPTVFLLLFLFALDPGPRRHVTRPEERAEFPGEQSREEAAAEEGAAVVFSIFFWVLLVAAVIALGANYLY